VTALSRIRDAGEELMGSADVLVLVEAEMEWVTDILNA
jgi:hypothetical protein